MSAARREAKANLIILGFRVDTRARYGQAKRDYQRAKGLPVTGIADPLTRRSLRNAVTRNREGRPDLSAHYSFREFVCKCGGRYATCRRIWVKRRLIVRLEKLRAAEGRQRIISGCRCTNYNASIGGASGSQHRYGRAADLEPLITARRMRDLRLFSGIGIVAATGKVAHVDVRTTASPANPITWLYR